MHTRIAPGAYHDPDVFHAENERLFQRVWQFFCLNREVANHHDYVARTIAGTPLMVQNFHGSLRAFVNVCSHRFSQLHADGTGNRPLQCLYHGWAYNADGVPVGIPDRPRFDNLKPECIAGLKLAAWRVETVGDLVFVCPRKVEISLRDFLANAYDQVTAWALALGNLIEVIDIPLAANWKVAVENTLEAYHLAMVHPTTFSWWAQEVGLITMQGTHSAFSHEVSPTTNDSFAKLSRLFATRLAPCSDYRHQLVFPNLTLATTWGATFSLQVFEPLSPANTRIRSFVFATKVSDVAVRTELLDAYAKSAAEFNRKVFEEDKAACERVQRGVVGAVGPGLLSDEESRVGAFHEYYERFMS